MTEKQEIRLAFIDVAVFPDGSIRGGILTTDIETRPFEFRITSPVKPTQVQQILYGATLKDYVYGELICAPLVKATKEKISIVLIKEPYILHVRPLISTPVALLQNHTSQQEVNGPRPVNISVHKNFSTELSYIQTILPPLAQQHDLLEPFERLKLALTEVHRMDAGGKGKSG